MSQLHIRANSGEIAPYVLLPGDPGRASYIADTFFDNPRRYNDYRQLLGYSGSYRGMPVSVQTTGMGCPSVAIVVEELIRLGARTLIRVGTSGIIDEAISPGELIIATASIPKDGTTRMYLKGEPYAPVASFAVTRALVDSAKAQGSRVHVGLIQTEDAFYATSPGDVPELARLGVMAVEMEAATLFLLGQLRKVETGCALVASNHIGDPQFVAPEVLQHAVHTMTHTALEALYSLHQRGRA